MVEAKYVFRVAVVIAAALVGFDLGLQLIIKEDRLRMNRAVVVKKN